LRSGKEYMYACRTYEIQILFDMIFINNMNYEALETKKHRALVKKKNRGE